MAKVAPLITRPLSIFLKEVKKNTWDPFWWIILMAIVFLLPFLRPWWWIFAPFFLSIELRVLYLWWIAWDFAYAKGKWVVLEIVPPKEVLIPIKAMEDVFSTMFSTLSDGANFREMWCEGELDNTPYWMSFEIVSIEGKIHFLARVMSQHRAPLETALYAHYPDLEIHEVPDYTKDVPQDIPNEEWDLYGEDFILGEPPAYPIKTYEKFFEPQGEKISAEEKRIDPINAPLEMMSRLGQGEQYWMQFIISGAFDDDEPEWRKEGEAIIAKLAKRPIKKPKTFSQELSDMIRNVIFGPQKVGSGEKATYKWISSAEEAKEGEREMVLTPGERDVVKEIENKLSKAVFKTVIRGLYIAKRENFHSGNGKIARSYMAHFQTKDLNHLKFSGITRTKIHDLFRKRRVFLRSRKIFRNAVARFTPLFPNRRKECAILSTEELATIFHFPIKINNLNFPTMERVEHKKGGAPLNLPIE